MPDRAHASHPRKLTLALLLATLGCGVYNPDLVNRADTGRMPDTALDAIDAAPDIVVEDIPPDTGCAAGQDLCGSVCANVRTDTMNCGRCGNVCPSAPNSMATCVAGNCGITCATEYDDCDANPANGCEAHLTADAQHCGTCPTACVGGTNATPQCDMGACRLRCLSGFADCDGNGANGCESALDAPTSCGNCTTVCPAASPLCSVMGTMGTCASGCAAGQTRCGASCVDTRTDPNNCGACGTRCPAATNATASCAASVCGVACAMGFGDCDRNTGNGCEIDLSTTSNCGACGTRCASSGLPGTTPACTMLACRNACIATRGDCDANPANGCEAPLDVATSCGACTTRCSSAQACAGTMCCALGTTRCGTATTCTNLNSDAANCGRCGVACGGATPTCCNGACIAGATCTGRYTVSTPAVAFANACSSVGHRTVLTLNDDGSVNIPQTTGMPLVTIPFQVRYYNTVMPVPFTVSTNGWLSLVGALTTSLSGTIPSASAPNSVLAPQWTDLYTRASGICYDVVGAAPNRRFIVQWQDLHYCCTDDPAVHLTFEVIIYEAPAGTNNTIDFVYSNLMGQSRTATVGIENQTGTGGTVVPGSFAAPTALRFTYVP